MESKKRNKGIICIIMSAFCFALMSFFVRMAGDLQPIQKKQRQYKFDINRGGRQLKGEV